MYPIQKIDSSRADDIEYLGTKRKFWFSMEGKRYLFKAEERGTGEDWAEKIVCELARELGMPHVEYNLAHEFRGDVPVQPGVICPSFASRPLALEMGNQLLMQRDSAYPGEEQVKYGVREYTVQAAADVVGELLLPDALWMKNIPDGIESALDVFAGYLMLDAWIANQDRHHQNWGAIRDAAQLRLAPTYDHGSALARNLQDKEREDRLKTKDKNRSVETFAVKARSGFYRTPDDKKTIPAIEVFKEFSYLAPNGAGIWKTRLSMIQMDTIKGILDNIPPSRMSPIAKEFTLKLLSVNQQRILELVNE